MKKLLLLTLVMCAFACKPKSEWTLVWEDNFDTLDENVWSRIDRGGSDWNRHMSLYDSLCEVKNGELILHAINNYTQKDDTAKVITGGVFSVGKKGFTNGRVDIRAKFTSAQGFWPAIWMLPNWKVAYPTGGEIDIMEHLNYDTIAYQTVHSDYTLGYGEKENPKSGATHGINKDEYNIYSVELAKDTLKFYINDIITNAYPRIQTEQAGQFPFFDGEYYILMDAQLGGAWVGPYDQTQLPASMTIDWVRFYQKNE